MATAKKAIAKRDVVNPDVKIKAKPAKAVAFKMPKSLAQCADLAYELRERRLLVAKEVQAIQAQETLVKKYLIDNLPKSQASGVSGKLANAKIVTQTVPTITDKAKFLAYVKKTGDFDLLTSSMNAKAVEERWENKKKVPGVGEFEIVKVSLNKVS